MNDDTKNVHAYFAHADKAFRLLPAAADQLAQLQEAFKLADEDFLAIELKTMAARLREIRTLMEDGPQG